MIFAQLEVHGLLLPGTLLYMDAGRLPMMLAQVAANELSFSSPSSPLLFVLTRMYFGYFGGKKPLVKLGRSIGALFLPIIGTELSPAVSSTLPSLSWGAALTIGEEREMRRGRTRMSACMLVGLYCCLTYTCTL